jgi:hypothetical protein
MGIKWGEDYSEISKKFILVRTKFGGTDQKPGYQVVAGLPLDIEGIPVVIYLQFVKDKLALVHIYTDKDRKVSLIDKFYEIYGRPKASPSSGIEVWQDDISSITLQKELHDAGCLFSLVNNASWMQLTGRTIRQY